MNISKRPVNFLPRNVEVQFIEPCVVFDLKVFRLERMKFLFLQSLGHQ